jgi:uncharacterized protein YjiK
MLLKPLQPFEKIFVSWRVFLVILTTGFIFSCSQRKKKIESPEGYNFSAGYRYTLPSVLNEISGLSYYSKDSSVFAIQDEKGFLFKIHFTNPLKIERWKFGNGADYEDVVLLDSSFYVLKSKGSIERLKFGTGDSISIDPFPIPAQGKNEFETLYYDDVLRRLIVICKNCDVDNKDQVTSFGFNPATNAFDTSFAISAEKIKDLAHEDKLRLKPSAAAIHPLTGELFVIASVDKLLVVFNKDHIVKAVYHLDPETFKQSEGMTFTPKGDLLISNESANKGSADILIFKYNQLKKRQ